jgi:hypothetical protein
MPRYCRHQRAGGQRLWAPECSTRVHQGIAKAAPESSRAQTADTRCGHQRVSRQRDCRKEMLQAQENRRADALHAPDSSRAQTAGARWQQGTDSRHQMTA